MDTRSVSSPAASSRRSTRTRAWSRRSAMHRTVAAAPGARSVSSSSRNVADPIVKVGENGGVPAAVTTLERAGLETHRNPTFLPDGRRFLYCAAPVNASPGDNLAAGGVHRRGIRSQGPGLRVERGIRERLAADGPGPESHRTTVRPGRTGRLREARGDRPEHRLVLRSTWWGRSGRGRRRWSTSTRRSRDASCFAWTAAMRGRSRSARRRSSPLPLSLPMGAARSSTGSTRQATSSSDLWLVDLGGGGAAG